MTRLDDALRHLAERGAPRHPDTVLAAARARAAHLRRRRLVAMGGVGVTAIAFLATVGVWGLDDEETTSVDSGRATAPWTEVGPTPTEPAVEASPPTAPTTSEESPDSTVDPGRGTVVDVFFLTGPSTGCSSTRAVQRRVEGPAVLRGALDALLRGPTEAERATGLLSTFSDATAGGVRSVDLVAGVAVVDLAGTVRDAMATASTSCGSASLLAQLDATVTQFPNVERAVYSYDGDVAAFYGSFDGVAPDGSSTTPEADGVPAWPGAVGLDPSGSLDTGNFAEHLARVDPQGALDVEAVASLLLHLEDERARGAIVLITDGSGDAGGRDLVVTLTNLGDDSVAEVRYELRFDRRPGLPTLVTSASWAQRCQPRRGHQDLRPELCA